MAMRNLLVAGNWKMNGDLALVDSMLSALSSAGLQQNTGVAIFPPALFLSALADKAEAGLQFGLQNCSAHDGGAHTGEITAQMASQLNAQMIIVGHSERRTMYADSDQVVAEKVEQIVAAGLIPVLCIGESESQREQNITESVLAAQLQAVLDIADKDALSKCIVAYEPIWAIGTGKTATPEMAQETHKFVRTWLSDNLGSVAQDMQILYGGSVKADNCRELFSQPDIDGGLIGGASLKVEDFVSIYQSAKELS